jgi:hypothetical protein
LPTAMTKHWMMCRIKYIREIYSEETDGVMQKVVFKAFV